jgi:hypothetical protein
MHFKTDPPPPPSRLLPCMPTRFVFGKRHFNPSAAAAAIAGHFHSNALADSFLQINSFLSNLSHSLTLFRCSLCAAAEPR